MKVDILSHSDIILVKGAKVDTKESKLNKISRIKRISNATDKKALKRSFWGSLSRVIGVALGASAGGLLHKIVGDGFGAIGTAIGMAIASFALIWFAEYERESG